MSATPSATLAPKQHRTQSLLTSGTALIVYVALVRLVLYFFAGPRYGYFRDELYYLACGEHPAWGYVDQPPLIGWISWLLQHTIGTSLWALRLLPALADAATILLAGLLARELGGRRWAMFLASLAALMAPVSLALSHLFTMNAFDPLLWAAIAYLVVRIVKTGNEPLWLAVGALAGLTILNKYAIIFWLSGLVIGVCLTPLRQSLRHRWFWFGCALAAAIALPQLPLAMAAPVPLPPAHGQCPKEWPRHCPSPRCLFSRPRRRCSALSPHCSCPPLFCSSSPGRAVRFVPSDGPISSFLPK